FQGPAKGYLNYCSVVEKYSCLAQGITEEKDYENDNASSTWVRNRAFEPCPVGATFMESAEHLNQGLRQKRLELGLPEELEDFVTDDDGLSLDGIMAFLDEESNLDENESTSSFEEVIVASPKKKKSSGKNKKEEKKSSLKKNKKPLAMKMHMVEKKKLNRSLQGNRNFGRKKKILSTSSHTSKSYKKKDSITIASNKNKKASNQKITPANKKVIKQQNRKSSQTTMVTSTKKNAKKYLKKDVKKINEATTSTKPPMKKLLDKKLMRHKQQKQSTKSETKLSIKEKQPQYSINCKATKQNSDRSARLQKRADEAKLREVNFKKSIKQSSETESKKIDETDPREEINLQKALNKESLYTSKTDERATISERVKLRSRKHQHPNNSHKKELQSKIVQLEKKQNALNAKTKKKKNHQDNDQLHNKNNIKHKTDQSISLELSPDEVNLRERVNLKKQKGLDNVIKNKDERKLRGEENLPENLDTGKRNKDDPKHIEGETLQKHLYTRENKKDEANPVEEESLRKSLVLENKNKQNLSTNETDENATIGEKVKQSNRIYLHPRNGHNDKLERYKQLEPIEKENELQMQSNVAQLEKQQEPVNECNSKIIIQNENIEKNYPETIKEVKSHCNNGSQVDDQLGGRYAKMYNDKTMTCDKQKSNDYKCNTYSPNIFGKYEGKIYKAKNLKPSNKPLSNVLLYGLTYWRNLIQIFGDNESMNISEQVIKCLNRNEFEKLLVIKPNSHSCNTNYPTVSMGQEVLKNLIGGTAMQNKNTDIDHKENEKSHQISVNHCERSVNDVEKQINDISDSLKNQTTKMIISDQDNIFKEVDGYMEDASLTNNMNIYQREICVFIRSQ
ncbi:unnamed protein product, partial [Meganyctiphanes norvegica]